MVTYRRKSKKESRFPDRRLRRQPLLRAASINHVKIPTEAQLPEYKSAVRKNSDGDRGKGKRVICWCTFERRDPWLRFKERPETTQL
ncbi:unnamed protein product [Cyprideis torosa]|uniref:Uncharacterized protein n=1 Tax=Cyprideis torosa TaxID=163714 RepID=A0A7R8WPI1_9CRUS|nr:unnamed protein product [Cyprideis torosa]CAG0901573.1 unnamed protein product [Cyprideis torosa]